MDRVWPASQQVELEIHYFSAEELITAIVVVIIIILRAILGRPCLGAVGPARRRARQLPRRNHKRAFGRCEAEEENHLTPHVYAPV